MSQTVAQWADELQEVRQEMELGWDSYPIALGLAFISVESNGVPTARKFPASQFYGLLQMGRPAGMDVGFANKGRKTTEALHGDGLRAIQCWYQYMNRYRERWLYESDVGLELRAAVLWKGGAGTARRIRDQVRSGAMDFWQAVRWIETHPNKKVRISNLSAYLRRMQRAYPQWQEWVEKDYEEVGVTPGPELAATASLPPWIGQLAEALLGKAWETIEKRMTV